MSRSRPVDREASLGACIIRHSSNAAKREPFPPGGQAFDHRPPEGWDKLNLSAFAIPASADGPTDRRLLAARRRDGYNLCLKHCRG
jgi:hypothetical protein